MRWNMDNSPIFIRTIREEDALAISHLTRGCLNAEQARNSILHKRQLHTARVVEDETCLIGPGHYHMVICYETEQGHAVIGTCGFAEMGSEPGIGGALRVGYLQFHVDPSYAQDPTIRDAAMRCLLSCGFAKVSHHGLQLDLIKLQPSTFETPFVEAALSCLCLDPVAGGRALEYKSYNWEVWKIRWIAAESRFDWMPEQRSTARASE